jgi:molecular chaperone GrpE
MTDADPTPEAQEAAPETDPVDGAAPADPAPAAEGEPASVEELIDALEATTAERDEYLDLARRTQAEFENYRKRVANQAADDLARATGGLVEQLLPVLDACDGAITHGSTEVEPIFAALLQSLEKQGLVRIDPLGEAFDPNQHEAVMHEPAADGDDGIVVSDVMRPGYGWKGLVIRPAMVKVRG